MTNPLLYQRWYAYGLYWLAKYQENGKTSNINSVPIWDAMYCILLNRLYALTKHHMHILYNLISVYAILSFTPYVIPQIIRALSHVKPCTVCMCILLVFCTQYDSSLVMYRPLIVNRENWCCHELSNENEKGKWTPQSHSMLWN